MVWCEWWCGGRWCAATSTSVWTTSHVQFRPTPPPHAPCDAFPLTSRANFVLDADWMLFACKSDAMPRCTSSGRRAAAASGAVVGTEHGQQSHRPEFAQRSGQLRTWRAAGARCQGQVPVGPGDPPASVQTPANQGQSTVTDPLRCDAVDAAVFASGAARGCSRQVCVTHGRGWPPVPETGIAPPRRWGVDGAARSTGSESGKGGRY